MNDAQPGKRQPTPPVITWVTAPELNRAFAALTARLVAAEERMAILESELKRRTQDF